MSVLEAEKTIASLIAEELDLQPRLEPLRKEVSRLQADLDKARADVARGRGTAAAVKAAESALAKVAPELESLQAALRVIAEELDDARSHRQAEYIAALAAERLSLEGEIPVLSGTIDDAIIPLAEACKRMVYAMRRGEAIRAELVTFGVRTAKWGAPEPLVGLAVEQLAKACGIQYEAPRLDRANTLREAIGK